LVCNSGIARRSDDGSCDGIVQTIASDDIFDQEAGTGIGLRPYLDAGSVACLSDGDACDGTDRQAVTGPSVLDRCHLRRRGRRKGGEPTREQKKNRRQA
jgi:hypothetical protein